MSLVPQLAMKDSVIAANGRGIFLCVLQGMHFGVSVCKGAGTMGGVVFGFILLSFGLVHLFGRDFLWQWTRASHSYRGVASEHSAEWDEMTQWIGIGLFILGAAVMGVSIGNVTKEDSRPTQNTTKTGRFQQSISKIDSGR